MNILLTTRKVDETARNPIALLDLAAFYRQSGHYAECRYLEQLQRGEYTLADYDVVCLSALAVTKHRQFVQDAQWLRTTFHGRVLVGGKYVATFDEMQTREIEAAGIEVWKGPGEQLIRPEEPDLTEYPAWDRKDLLSLGVWGNEIMSSRGCPYHCHFCHNTERTVRFFSARRTADNIELLFSLGQPDVYLVDDIFALNAVHMANLYEELLGRGISIAGRCRFFVHVNAVAPDTLAWMQKYKPWMVEIGIESGDQEMLNLMGKRTSPEKIRSAVRELSRHGLQVRGLFLIGFPGETERSLLRTLRFVPELKPFLMSVWVSFYQPVPFTRGCEMAAKRVGTMHASRTNTDVTYVDPNLTKKTLVRFRKRMMAENGWRCIFRDSLLWLKVKGRFLRPLWRWFRMKIKGINGDVQ